MCSSVVVISVLMVYTFGSVYNFGSNGGWKPYFVPKKEIRECIAPARKVKKEEYGDLTGGDMCEWGREVAVP